jgi:putative DNA-invertase from lambdoid prophage Rac
MICHVNASVSKGDDAGVQLGQVAIYCRVSTDDQSCERQERDLRAYAKRAGHKIVAVFKETASGADNARPERAKTLALARAHEIDAILVTELSRWGRSTQDLVQSLDDLHGWKVSVLAQTGLSFDLSTSSGKLMRTIMAGLAEFERDLIRERVKSGLASAKARGFRLGRQVGQRPSDKKAKKVIAMHQEGLSYRLIGRNVGLSKNTVMDIIKRSAAPTLSSRGCQLPDLPGLSAPQRYDDRQNALSHVAIQAVLLIASMSGGQEGPLPFRNVGREIRTFSLSTEARTTELDPL